MRTIVHTLGYNVPGMVQETALLTRNMNMAKPFEYIIAHCGFPLTEFHQGEVTPEGIKEAHIANGMLIRQYAADVDAQVVTIRNQGVSPNWEFIRQKMQVGDDDVLICADPDERPEQENWVHALAEVMQADKRIAWCSLMMREQVKLLSDPRFKWSEKTIAGHRVYIMHTYGFNWAQGGFSGRFLNSVGGVQAMEKAPIYGWIENAATNHFGTRWDYAILADFYVEHIASPPLYGEWKDWVCSPAVIDNGKQVDFETWLLNNKVYE